MRRPELLAPAGDYACFRAALKAGADAVYLGGHRYGARAFAGNFNGEEVVEALKEAHFYGRKIYLTVNTLMRQEELDGLEGFIAPFWEAGLDGAIVQDVGALSVLGKCFPSLPLHASTQMTVTDAAGAEALKALGIVRVVPARELSLEEVAALRRESGLEVEVFIHGSMCYSYSGQCLFSSFLGGRSGNRGRCAQPCRQPYGIVDERGTVYPARSSRGGCGREGGGRADAVYPLSLKDMCTVDLLPELVKAGMDSFKIEGRMKKPEYVAGVTSAYRRQIDACLASSPGTGEADQEDRRILSSLYIRSQVGSGYYDRHNGREMVALTRPGYVGTDERLLERIRKEVMEPPLNVPVSMEATLQEGKPCKLVAWDGEGNSASAEGDLVPRAQKHPLTEEEARKRLCKSGGSGFTVREIRMDMEGDIFLPVRTLNELRRKALDGLRERRIAAYVARRREREGKKPCVEGQACCPEKEDSGGKGMRRAQRGTCGEEGSLGQGSSQSPFRTDAAHGPSLHVTVTAQEQLEACLAAEVDRIYLPVCRMDGGLERLIGVVGAVCGSGRGEKAGGSAEERKGTEFFLSFPVIMRRETEEKMEAVKDLLDTGYFTGVQIGSLSALTWLERLGWKGKVAFDHRIYIWNRQTLEFWKDRMDTYCAPLELDRKELYALPIEGMPRKEVLSYGRIPMMVTANCVYKTMGKCREGSDGWRQAALRDRFGVLFPVRTDCGFCYNIIYNSVPLSLHGHVREMARNGVDALRLDFLEEDGRKTGEILALFQDAREGRSCQVSYPFTTGHFKKGAQ